MLKMCRVFDIPFQEGLRQYVPRKNGRPYGPRETKEVRTR
jgi:hypothetical protein